MRGESRPTRLLYLQQRGSFDFEARERQRYGRGLCAPLGCRQNSLAEGRRLLPEAKRREEGKILARDHSRRLTMRVALGTQTLQIYDDTTLYSFLLQSSKPSRVGLFNSDRAFYPRRRSLKSIDRKWVGSGLVKTGTREVFRWNWLFRAN